MLLQLSSENKEMTKIYFDFKPTCFDVKINHAVAGFDNGWVCLVDLSEIEHDSYEVDLKNPDFLKSPSNKSSSQNSIIRQISECKKKYFDINP